MSIKVMTAVFETTLPPSEKIVALKLADHAHDDGTSVYPSAASLATNCSLSERQVRRTLKILLAKGIIIKDRSGGGRTTNLYHFSLDKYGKITPASSDNLTPLDTSDDVADVMAPLTPEAASSDMGDRGIIITINEPLVETPSETPTALPSKPIKTYPPVVCELNNYLCQLIDHNGSRVPSGGEVEMDKLLRIDKRDPAEVRAVIEWSQSNPFWRANILSSLKLRKQYDMLRLQAIADGANLPKSLSSVTLDQAKVWEEYDSYVAQGWDTNEPAFPRPTDSNGNLLDGDGRAYYIDPMDYKRRYVDDE